MIWRTRVWSNLWTLCFIIERTSLSRYVSMLYLYDFTSLLRMLFSWTKLLLDSQLDFLIDYSRTIDSSAVFQGFSCVCVQSVQSLHANCSNQLYYLQWNLWIDNRSIHISFVHKSLVSRLQFANLVCIYVETISRLKREGTGRWIRLGKPLMLLPLLERLILCKSSWNDLCLQHKGCLKTTTINMICLSLFLFVRIEYSVKSKQVHQ